MGLEFAEFLSFAIAVLWLDLLTNTTAKVMFSSPTKVDFSYSTNMPIRYMSLPTSTRADKRRQN